MKDKFRVFSEIKPDDTLKNRTAQIPLAEGIIDEII